MDCLLRRHRGLECGCDMRSGRRAYSTLLLALSLSTGVILVGA